MPGCHRAASIIGHDEPIRFEIGFRGLEPGFCTLQLSVNAATVGFSDGFLAGPAAKERGVLFLGGNTRNFFLLMRGEYPLPQTRVDAVRYLDIDADLNLARYGQGAPVFCVAEVEAEPGGAFQLRLSVLSTAPGYFSGFAVEIAGQNLPHPGMRAHPARAV